MARDANVINAVTIFEPIMLHLSDFILSPLDISPTKNDPHTGSEYASFR